MQKLNFIIVDDEPLAHDVIISYAENISWMELKGQAHDAVEAMNLLQEYKIDLIFLDIEMPKLTGLDFVKTLEHRPQIIITTAYEEYALEGYEINVTDYLLKPFSLERFLKAINKLKRKGEVQGSVHESKSEPQQTIFIKADSKVYQIKLSEILYIESIGAYVKIHTSNKTLTMQERLSYFDENLPENQFVRIHKSFIVALDKVENIEGNQAKVNDEILPIGRHYKKDFQERIKLF